MSIELYLAFIAATIILMAIPGPNVALIVANSVAHGTRFGLLTPNTINGDVPRNLGTMPALVHLDTNLSRAWKIGRAKTETARTVTLNARAANLLNHTNATAVSTVVGSPNFSDAVAAESARRLELGVRFTF